MVAKELQFAKQINREGREWREEKYHGRRQRHMRRQGNKQMHRQNKTSKKQTRAGRGPDSCGWGDPLAAPGTFLRIDMYQRWHFVSWWSNIWNALWMLIIGSCWKAVVKEKLMDADWQLKADSHSSWILAKELCQDTDEETGVFQFP
jgi:hypothetical protein